MTDFIDADVAGNGISGYDADGAEPLRPFPETAFQRPKLA